MYPRAIATVQARNYIYYLYVGGAGKKVQETQTPAIIFRRDKTPLSTDDTWFKFRPPLTCNARGANRSKAYLLLMYLTKTMLKYKHIRVRAEWLMVSIRASV